MLSPGYLSLTIDTSLVLGGHWWGKAKGVSRGVATETVAPIDLRDPRLIDLCETPRPRDDSDRGYGSGPCRLPDRKEEEQEAGRGARRSRRGPDQELVLKKRLWKRINAFASTVGFEILFVVNAGPGQRDATGAWMDSNARALIAYTARKGFPVRAWELGNEVNAYPVTHGFRHRVRASRYVEDFARFSRLVRKLHPRRLWRWGRLRR